jgi:copper chaperone CopZ
LKVPEGIEEVQANSVSGTVLLNYDEKKVSEKEILSFITSLIRVFVSQRDDLARLLKNDTDTIFNCLRDWLQRTVTQRLHLDVTQRILSDDFH